MAKPATTRDYQFVGFDGPQIPQDAHVRTAVRKQAMKDVGAARRKTGDYGRVNLGQYLVIDEVINAEKQKTWDGEYDITKPLGLDPRTSAKFSLLFAAGAASKMTDRTIARMRDPSRRAPQLPSSTEPHQNWPNSLAINPPNSYEALRAKYQFDVSDLWALTTFHIGRSTVSAVAKNPDLLATLLGGQSRSYLSFVPARYGHKPYLDAVVDCVTAKARAAMRPPSIAFTKKVTLMHTKALHAISKAVTDENASRDADLLCAVQMLSIYEVREPTHSSEQGTH